MQIKIDYDEEDDILYFYTDEKKVDYSIDYDDIILDVSGNKIVGVEIMDASEKFANLEEEVSKLRQAMNSIKEAYMKVDYTTNSIRVKIGFVSSIPEFSKEGMLIQVPIQREMMISA